jgi:hypothetical protein
MTDFRPTCAFAGEVVKGGLGVMKGRKASAISISSLAALSIDAKHVVESRSGR